MRGSDHANRRLDEQRAHETAGLTHGAPIMERDDARLQEAPTADERTTGAHRPRSADVHDDGALSIDERNRLADFARWFRPSAFPGTVLELRDQLAADNAPAPVVEALGHIPAGTRFESVSELWRSVEATR